MHANEQCKQLHLALLLIIDALQLALLRTGDTCDLLIIDRPFDLISTVTHEWSYEAMAADVLGLQNNVFQYDADTQAGVVRVR